MFSLIWQVVAGVYLCWNEHIKKISKVPVRKFLVSKVLGYFKITFYWEVAIIFKTYLNGLSYIKPSIWSSSDFS